MHPHVHTANVNGCASTHKQRCGHIRALTSRFSYRYTRRAQPTSAVSCASTLEQRKRCGAICVRSCACVSVHTSTHARAGVLTPRRSHLDSRCTCTHARTANVKCQLHLGWVAVAKNCSDSPAKVIFAELFLWFSGYSVEHESFQQEFILEKGFSRSH